MIASHHDVLVELGPDNCPPNLKFTSSHSWDGLTSVGMMENAGPVAYVLIMAQCTDYGKLSLADIEGNTKTGYRTAEYLSHPLGLLRVKFKYVISDGATFVFELTDTDALHNEYLQAGLSPTAVADIAFYRHYASLLIQQHSEKELK